MIELEVELIEELSLSVLGMDGKGVEKEGVMHPDTTVGERLLGGG